TRTVKSYQPKDSCNWLTYVTVSCGCSRCVRVLPEYASKILTFSALVLWLRITSATPSDSWSEIAFTLRLALSVPRPPSKVRRKPFGPKSENLHEVAS